MICSITAEGSDTDRNDDLVRSPQAKQYPKGIGRIMTPLHGTPNTSRPTESHSSIV